MNKKWLIALVILLAAGGAGAFGWQYWIKSAAPVGVSASNGRIEAEQIEIASKLAGRIVEVMVSEGDWVAPGQAIARMDTAELEAQRHQAQATVLQAQQQKLQAEAVLRQRQSELVLAQTAFGRVERLATDAFASQAALDNGRNTLNTAKAGVAAAEAGVPLAEATIAAAQAAVDRLQGLINDATLTAPRAGRVQYVLAHAGEVIASGGRVVSLTDLSDMSMSIYLPSRDAGRLAIGAEARIILDAIPEYVIPATVTFVASTAQFTPRSVETQQERDQLMFRVKLTIAPELLEKYADRARAGVPGTGYVLVNDGAEWPADLAVRLPQ